MNYIDLESDTIHCSRCNDSHIAIDKAPVEQQRKWLLNERWEPYYDGWQCPDCAAMNRLVAVDRIRDELNEKWQIEEAFKRGW